MNRFFALRHGYSRPNEVGIVISSLTNGVRDEHGLNDLGREQARLAGEKLLEIIGQENAKSVIVYTSPFSRTKETALYAMQAAGLDKESLIEHEALRERFFGTTCEGGPSEEVYQAIWSSDKESVESKSGEDGESLISVQTRLSAFIRELEGTHQGKVILLVSHGDTLSILEQTMQGLDLRSHRDRAYSNGQLRLLQLKMQ